MYSEYDLYMALGDLALTKVAGDIDGDAFDYYADLMVKEAAGDPEAVMRAQAEALAAEAQERNRANVQRKAQKVLDQGMREYGSKQVQGKNGDVGKLSNKHTPNPAGVRAQQADALVEDAKNKAMSRNTANTSAPAAKQLSRWQRAKNWVIDAAKAKDIQAGWKGVNGKKAWGQLAKGVAKTGLVYGAPIGAIGSGAYYLTHRNSK